jgi:hypothetical protein
MLHLTSLSFVVTFLKVARADFDEDCQNALLVLSDLPEILASPFCSDYLSRYETTTTRTKTDSPVTTTTTLAPTLCSESPDYISVPWKTKVCETVSFEAAY